MNAVKCSFVDLEAKELKKHVDKASVSPAYPYLCDHARLAAEVWRVKAEAAYNAQLDALYPRAPAQVGL